MIQLLSADVTSCEEQGTELTEQTAGYTVGIAASQLGRGEIRTDKRSASAVDSGIYYIVYAGDCELIRYFDTEVVDNKKVTGEKAFLCCAFVVSANASQLNCSDIILCSCLYNVKAEFDDDSCNRGGKVGLSKPRASDEKP